MTYEKFFDLKKSDSVLEYEFQDYQPYAFRG